MEFECENLTALGCERMDAVKNKKIGDKVDWINRYR